MTTARAGRWAPVIPCAAILLALGSIVMVQPIFKNIGVTFGLEITAVRVSFSTCSLAYAIAFFLLGPLTDRFNLTRLALGSALGLGCSVTLCALAPSFSVFNLGIALLGGFAAGLVSSMFPYMTKIAPPGKAGSYLGLCLSATVTGIILGRTVIGILTGLVGWRYAMASYSIPVYLLALVLVRLPALPVVGGARPSVVQQYTQAMSLLATPQIVRRYLAGFLLFFGYLGTLTFLTFYLVRPPFNLSVAQIGWLSLAGLGGAVVAPKAGAFAQAYGVSRVVRIGVLLAVASFAIMLVFRNTAAVTLGLLVLYAGVYVCQPAVFYDISRAIRPQQMGAASSLYLLACLSGGSLGSYALGPVWQRWGWTGVMLAAGTATLGTLLLAATGEARARPMSVGLEAAASSARGRQA